MISLNTLRTKFGIVLSIVIGLALFAFIISLKSEMGFTGNDPVVGEVDGSDISYTEYFDEYKRVESSSGGAGADEQQADMLANAAWQSIISKYILIPGFEDISLVISNAERLSMISGEQATQTLYNAFADPRTGQYNVMAVNQFLAEVNSNPQAQQMWTSLIEQAKMERLAQKYIDIVRNGAFVNSLEVNSGIVAANNVFEGRWASKSYSSVSDSLFTVSSTEVNNYYDLHKESYKQNPSRSISYVVFEVEPTADDLIALEDKAIGVGNEFEVADNIRAFARANRGVVSESYISQTQLSNEEVEALASGNQYGPILKNNLWTISRTLDSKMAPDSIGIRHIVLQSNSEKLADSLMTVLNKGGNFAQLAAQYSMYEQTAANGGDVGIMPFSAFTGEFVAPLSSAKKGDLVKIVSGDAIQLIQVYRADKRTKHLQIATITYPIEASPATIRTINGAANVFMAEAKEGVEAFNIAADSAALTPRVATISQGERSFRGLDDSRQVARWAFGAEEGDLSEVFTVGKNYVVAILTGINNNTYTPVENVKFQINSAIMRDKKFEYISKTITGNTIEEQAKSLDSEIGTFADVNYSAFYIDGMGVEPRVIGAISASEKGTVSTPIKGGNSLYVFVVDEVVINEKQTFDAEKIRAQAMVENIFQQASLGAVQEMANVKDLRGQFF